MAIYTRQAVCAPIRAEEGLLGVLCPPGSSVPYRELGDDAAVGGYPTAVQLADLGVDAMSLDSEGRCLVVEFPAFVLFGVYSPANSNGTRDDFSIGFRCALDIRIRNLADKGKNVILTGDLNISREPIDSARAEESMREEGETIDDYLNRPTRRLFNQLVDNSRVPGRRDEGREKPVLVDLCREFHPDREGMYTHWEQKINARPGNFGSRIDFVLCSIGIKSWFCKADIQEGLMGSDHCPVYACTKDSVDWHGEDVPIVDILNPPGMFSNGKRIRDYAQAKDTLPMSGRLLPEFDKRRSIKDMFAKKPSASPTPDPVSNPAKTTVPTIKSTIDIATPLVSPPKRPEKRRTPGLSPAKPCKRSKTLHPTSKGQQSLKGFFVQAAAPAPIAPQLTPNEAPASPPPLVPTATAHSGPELDPIHESFSHATDAASPSSQCLVDPGAVAASSRSSWSKLFAKKAPPLCEHGEPCTIYTVKKAGPNCGRQFFLCSRYVRPSKFTSLLRGPAFRSFCWLHLSHPAHRFTAFQSLGQEQVSLSHICG